MKRLFVVGILFFAYVIVDAQTNVSNMNWHWKDYQKDTVHGISLRQAYQYLASVKNKPTPIIVAVMDGGVDTSHFELKNKLWTNPKEIPYNGIDDDKNGYIDDIHGWNFLGGRDGQNIDKAADEKSRIYHRFKSHFENITDLNELKTEIQKNQYLVWKQTEKEIEFTDEDAANLQYIKMATNALQKLGKSIIKEINDTNFTIQALEPFQPLGRSTLDAKLAYLRTAQIIGIEKETPFTDVINELKEYIEGKEKSAKAITTPPENIRATIIKDNYESLADKFYGNNNITGPGAKHGTHVAGLVASIPDSNWNVNKLYPPIQIMGVRVVPNGDEYDKDVALGIRYAVDNGAKIINMSFGKSYSPEQIWVDSAIRYAASKDVLIIHAAGNEFYDLDVKPVYPNPYSQTLKDTANNVLTVAASSDFFINGTLLTDFSNFGPSIVDVLAPGEKIYSTIPGANNHGFLQGTSMAAPIVSHIAAMIRSYYPNIPAVDVKKIIKQSVWKPNEPDFSYDIPQKEETKSLQEIASAGGIVNAAKALQIASIINSQKASNKTKYKSPPNK
jgi:subtilisin family serine protease